MDLPRNKRCWENLGLCPLVSDDLASSHVLAESDTHEGLRFRESLWRRDKLEDVSLLPTAIRALMFTKKGIGFGTGREPNKVPEENVIDGMVPHRLFL